MEIANKFREEVRQLYLKTDSPAFVSMHEYLKPKNREIVFPAMEIAGKDVLFRITRQYIHNTIDENSSKIGFIFNKINLLQRKIHLFVNEYAEDSYFFDKFFGTQLFKKFIVESLSMFANIDFNDVVGPKYQTIGNNVKVYGVVRFKTGQMRELLNDDYFSPFSLPIVRIDGDYYFLMPATFIPH